MARTSASRLVDALRERLFSLDGVSERPSRFGGSGLAFCRGTREFAHFHPGAEVDIRLPRAQQRALKDDPRAVFRPRPSDWIAYRLEATADVEAAFALARAAWAAAE
jgi:hypothetical protein